MCTSKVIPIYTRSNRGIAGWVYDMATTVTTVTDVIARIQYGRITVILNKINETNTEKEGS